MPAPIEVEWRDCFRLRTSDCVPFSLVAVTVDVVRKIVKGDELDFVDAQAKPDKKGAKKPEARSEDAVVAEGWLEALGYFELRSRLVLNIQRTDGPV